MIHFLHKKWMQLLKQIFLLDHSSNCFKKHLKTTKQEPNPPYYFNFDAYYTVLVN